MLHCCDGLLFVVVVIRVVKIELQFHVFSGMSKQKEASETGPQRVVA